MKVKKEFPDVDKYNDERKDVIKIYKLLKENVDVWENEKNELTH